MEKYNKYKESGIEWIGEIPKHWDILRLKSAGKVNQGLQIPISKRLLVNEKKAEPYITIRKINSPESTQYYIKTPYKNVVCNYDDILIARTGATGQVVTGVKGVFHNNFFIYKYNKKKYNKNYLMHYLKADFITSYLLMLAGTTTIPDLNHSNFYSIPLIETPLKEQTQIANYLDAKTTAIDKKVSLLQQKIKHYKAYRKTVINETVTKGLDKTVKLKDSGINWIGEIPEHWDIKRIKDIFSISRGRAIGKTELKDKGLYPVYSSQTKNKGILGYINTYDFNANLLTWTTDGVNAGTVFIREGKFNCTNICGTLIPNRNPKLSLEYMVFAVQESTKHNKRIDTNGAKIMSNEMAVINIVFPPIEEQIKIASHIKSKTESISKVLKNIETQIATLKELRKTLINEVVTGKVKVSA